MRLIDDWRRELWRLWSIRAAIFTAALTGLSTIWFALEGAVPLWVFVTIGVLLPVLVVVLRLMKQDDE